MASNLNSYKIPLIDKNDAQITVALELERI